ncbi:MAG: carboxylesterase family protein [Dehalococcoidia bacterium]|nr:carboxylesterase family protein [Dehalococcoidia bacterium]
MTDPIATTRHGQVRGVEKAGLLNFRGIPFAAPPVGPLRFRAPEPPEPWDGIRDATQNGPISPQAPSPIDLPGGPPVQRPMDEDCLTLNVWTPAADGSLPVMVWIHGGAFTIGCGADFSGRDLAARGAVVITINYRLGPLGFLALPCLADEQGRFTNFGLRDQIAALRWVRENAAAFGGDPGNVTIFGESAGGMSVGALMASPEAKGLFHRAIAQSGAGHHALTLEAATGTARRICEILGVSPDDGAGLRAAPAAELVRASSLCETEDMQRFIGRGRVWKPTFAPVVDSQALRVLPISAVNRGDGSDVPLLVGSNADEYRSLVQVAPLSEPEVVARFAELGLDGRAAFERYGDARRKRGEPASPRRSGRPR